MCSETELTRRKVNQKSKKFWNFIPVKIRYIIICINIIIWTYVPLQHELKNGTILYRAKKEIKNHGYINLDSNYVGNVQGKKIWSVL